MPRLNDLNLLVAVLLTLLTPALASADPEARLDGRVIDGPTETPIEGALIRVGGQMTTTDGWGEFSLTVPAGEQVLEVVAPLPDGQIERLHQTGLLFDEGADHWREIRLVTGAFLGDQAPIEGAMGVPLHRHHADEPEESRPIDLYQLWLERLEREGGPTLDDLQHLVLPDVLPDTIRVLRRYPNSCSGTDYPITEVDLDTYAAGVVTAEIGVFRALTTGEETQLEGFKALAVAGRSYALWFWADDPDAAWHLDDTACNQRYTDGPYPDIIREAAQATSGQILVQAGTTGVIDKFEYAASCGRCGSRPEYQDALVPDETGQNACTGGGWCGHNNCAAHQDNPDCPINGGERCLVRGVCQWGLAERSARGDSYLNILGHYQPNLDVRGVDAPSPARLLGFVRDGDIDTGDNIDGAEVRLDGGDLSITGESGLYVFESLPPGQRTLTVEAAGYAPVTETVEVVEGIDNWHSVAVTLLPSEDVGPDVSADMGQPDLDTTADTGVDVGQPDTNDPPDADTADQVASDASPAFSRFALVGPDGLEEGCGCGLTAATSAADRPWHGGGLVVLLCLVGLLTHRNAHQRRQLRK